MGERLKWAHIVPAKGVYLPGLYQPREITVDLAVETLKALALEDGVSVETLEWRSTPIDWPEALLPDSHRGPVAYRVEVVGERA